VADVQRQAMNAKSDQLIGYADPALNTVTPRNAPMPGSLFDDPRNMRDISAGLLGGVAPPASRPGMPAPGMPTPTPRASNPTRPGLPTPMSRPSPSMAAPSTLSAGVQERMTGIPMSDRQITASIPDMPAASAMLSRTAPSINPQPPMERPTAMAGLSPAVQERMGGFPDAPAPAQRAATPDLAPSVMDRMGGLLSMDAKAATMPNSRANGLLADTPPSFGVPDAIAYADPVPSRPAPSYQAPPASYQTPAFSTACLMAWAAIDMVGVMLKPPRPALARPVRA